MKKLVLLICVSFVIGGCDKLPNLPTGPAAAKLKKPDPPKVTVKNVTLVNSPSNKMLAMYYCPDLANSFVCRIFGARPAKSQLRFSFSVELDVMNPNNIPLPAVEALVGLKAFPERGANNFGAACIALCEEGTECGPPPAGSCTESGDQVLKTKSDYAAAAANFLINTAVGNTSPADLKFRTIPAGANITIKAQFDLNIDAMLGLIRNVAGDSLAQVKKGKVPTFTVPYEVEGTVWVSIESFGKIGASFPVHAGTWNLR